MPTNSLSGPGSLVILALLLAACTPTEEAMQQTTQTSQSARESDLPEPPLAPRRDHVISAPAGDRVDPWYWLRDDDRQDAEVLAYLEAENAYEAARLSHLADLRAVLLAEMRGRIPADDVSVPFHDRGYWYHVRYEQDLEYPIHARRKDDPQAKEQIILDVNAKARDHSFYQVGGWDVSMDGSRLAWLEDTVGRRQFRIMLKDLDTGRITDTGITGASSVSWSGDNQVFYYVEDHPETLRSWRVRRYRVGQDGPGELVYQEDDPAFYTRVSRTASNAFNVIELASTVASEMRVIESDDVDGRFRVFYPRERHHEYAAEHLGERWIIRTNYQAPNFRIMSVALDARGDRDAWEEVIAHSQSVFIHQFGAFDSFLAIGERSGGLRRIRIHRWEDGESELLTFDEPAYSAYLDRNLDPGSDSLRFVYTSMTTPHSTWELDVASGKRTLLKQNEVPGGFDPAQYVTVRTWARARDGAHVPVSILHHRNTRLDGTAPLYQYAYGAYGISSDPTFSGNRFSLVDRGFVFAIAHVRGGQEMGRDWYDQGRLRNKTNTFTDFIDVTGHLVDQGLVDADRVFAMGGSAGGLLMGAVANKAPELYSGLVAHVPFVDVVTTMLDESIPLTTNEYDEWGNPLKPDYYEYILSYSPYDNVTAQDYPAIMVTTGLWDSQVQYWEPAKWVARLRHYKTDDNPLLLHTNMQAGHGGASGRFRRLDSTATEYAFILDLAGLAEVD